MITTMPINLKHERVDKTNHIMTKPKYVNNLMLPSHTHITLIH
jgi:hypothetical protein